MTDATISSRLDQMASALHLIAVAMGTRLNREQMAGRLGIHRNTLATRLSTDRDMPRPGKDGKWLLSDVIAWEQRGK